MKKTSVLVLLSVMIMFSMILAACSTPAPTTAPAEPPPAEATAAPAEPTAEPAAPEAAPEGETITVIFPKHEADIKGVFEARVQEFEKESGITVNLIQSDWESVANRIIPEMATKGSAYDVVEFDNGWVAEWCGAGWVTPLNDYMPANYTEGMIPGLVDLFSCGENVLYGVVWNNDTRFFYYNEAVLKEAGFDGAPKNWEEFTAQSLEAQKQGLVKFGMAPFWSPIWSLANDFHFWTYAFGGTMVDEKGCFTFNTDANTLKAVEFMANTLTNGVSDPAGLTYDQATSQDVFLKGNSLFMPQGIAGLLTYTKDESISNVNGKIQAGLVPTSDAGTTAALTLPEAYAIPIGSQHKEAAWKFIEFMTSRDTSKYLAKEIGSLPIWLDLFSDPELVELYPYWAEFQNQLPTAKGLTKLTWYSDFVDIANTEIHKALAGEQTPQQALDSMADQLSQFNCVP